jgi:putative addiction module component (TIGR02574 family)
MGKEIKAKDILGLPFDKRLELVEDIWDSLAADAQSVPIPDWHRAEIKRRLDRHKANPGTVEAWEDVRARLGAKKAKRPKP